MHTQAQAAMHRQRGVSTLVVAIVLLIAATFLTFFAAKVGMQEQRMSGNDYRHKEAFSVAEALLDRAKMFLEANSTATPDWTTWSVCSGTAAPCGDGASNVFGATWSWVSVRDLPSTGSTSGADALGTLNGEAYILTQDVAVSGGTTEPIVLVATGRSEDQTGQAIVRQAQKKVFTLQPGPIPPLTAPMVGVLGSFHLVGNPNHLMKKEELLQITPTNCDNYTSGSGQMLSIWSRDTFDELTNGVTSWDICQAQFFKTNTDPLLSSNSACYFGTATSGCGCQSSQDPSLSVCSSQQFETSTDPNKLTACGIKDDDDTFPDPVFEWAFGASPEDVKSRADAVLDDCSSLSAASTGLFWITGECKPTAVQVGSRTGPVILVVEGDVDFGANKHVWGLVVAHNSPQVKLGGGFTIHGAMIVDSDATDFHASGTYNAIYDPCVFAAIFNNEKFVEFAPVQGSWSDQLQ